MPSLLPHELGRKEDDLKWFGRSAGLGRPCDSMGRLADAAGHCRGSERMGRVQRVRRALADSGPSALRMIAQRLAGIDLSTIWPILHSVCEDIALYYGGSVLAGGVIGGGVGALIGGVGAVPGAAVGAAAGAYVGGAVLSLLGLKSLVEGVFQAVPEAFGHYERGFREAWGPTRQDHLSSFGMTPGGNPSTAAFFLAQGHVMMAMTILSVLLAYITRGKDGRAAALKDISRSPRLGPKIAQWFDHNEARLSQHPLLRSRGGGGAGHGEPPAPPPPPPKRRGPDDKPERPRPNGMPKKVVPCFKTNDLPRSGFPEFDRQLAGQERGLNSMTVDEYIRGRALFDSKEAVRDPRLALKARTDYKKELVEKLTEEYRTKGLFGKAAETQAEVDATDIMKTLAALHNPDMVAGGKDAISDFGDLNINKRIGAQWKRGDRLSEIDKAATAVAKALRTKSQMNVRLERCK